VKRGKKKQTRRAERTNKVANKPPETPLRPALKAWHTGGLVFVLVAIAIGWLTWVCTRNPNINFLPRHGQAEWILFPSVMDSSAHHVTTLDTIFRREFLLNERPQVAQLDIRAAKHAELKINGSSVEIGSSRN